jgi:tetratricopeptide (TPR) repeat protein
VAAVVVVMAVAHGVGAQRVAAAPLLPSSVSASPFWERVGGSGRQRVQRLLSLAESILAAPDAAVGTPASRSGKLVRSEDVLRQALDLAPDDFVALMLLAEVQLRAMRPAAALATLERACPRAPPGAGGAACWFRLGLEHSRQGRYAEGFRAYDHLMALGDADATVYANAAEILMALGRMEEAEARYREAIRLDVQAAGRMENAHSLTLSTYGLAVALDRDEQSVAAREMMARALALDPRLGKLRAAEQPGGDVFFVPEGDVFYYLGLASEVAGHPDDAQAAFQEFLSRLPRSRWAPRARAHIDAAERAAHAPPVAHAGPSLRVIAAGTVLASGPIPAPLLAAAWRQRPRLLDDCLDEAVRAGQLPPRDGFRFALELEIDARGLVTGVVVKTPPPLDEPRGAAFARCVEAALRDGLRVAHPRPARPTRARMELLVGVANGDAGGL